MGEGIGEREKEEENIKNRGELQKNKEKYKK